MVVTNVVTALTILYLLPAAETVDEPLPVGTTTVLDERTLPEGGKMYGATVACPRIPDFAVQIRVTGSGTAGTILLSTGGSGTTLYSQGGEFGPEVNVTRMMDRLRDDGYLLVEIAWENPGIWVTLPESPVGSRTLACRYATVAVWAHENLHRGGFFAAQGNSGGSAQIAFSLAYYGLDEILDLANLSGGPPVCPLAVGDNRLRLFDCFGGPGQWNESREPLLSGSPRLHYPNTLVRFFLGQNEPTQEIVAGAYVYYHAITSEKSMEVVANTEHQVQQTVEGTTALMESIRGAAK